LLGKLFLSVPMVMLGAVFILALDCALLYLAVRLFRRETILTRWK
jgi:hypothetical protein